MSSIFRPLRLDYEIAAARMRVAMLVALSACIKAGYRQDQSRGTDGRWDGGGGRRGSGHKDKTGNPKIDSKTELLVDIIKEVDALIGPGNGASYGVQIHVLSASMIRDLDIPGIGRDEVEQSFSLGDSVRYGLAGSVRTDVILRDCRTASAPILAIWDFKTGGAQLTRSRIEESRSNLGVDDDVPVIEIHISRGAAVKSDHSMISGAIKIITVNH